jgi:hypothetical protein
MMRTRLLQHQCWFLLVFSSFCSLCLCGSTVAQLDPEKNSPYELQIVVRIPAYPPFTSAFRDQVKRELRDSLQAAYADLVRVEMADAHPLFKDIDSKGLQAALEGWTEVSPRKTHFVLIDFKNGEYEIQAGQHDGLTGLASPVARRARTPDRQFVAHMAALMIDRDFGLVGTLEPNARGPDVQVILKAGGLGIPMSRWLKKEHVFAIAQIKKVGGSQRSFRVPWALLKVVEEPKEGVCRCQLFNRYQDALEKGPAVLGYRCIKLGTTTAPLHFRLVNAKDKMALAGQAVAVSAGDFSAKPKEERSTQADGSIQTRDAFQNIAFVRILGAGGETRAKIPVEILEDHPVICPFSVTAQAEAQEQFQLTQTRLFRRLYESHLVVAELTQELNRLIENHKGKEAIDTAQRGLKAMDTDIANYTEELAGLKKTAQELPKGGTTPRSDLSEGEQRLNELKVRRKELQAFADSLNKALQEAKSPERQQAQLSENAGEFEKAIQLYEAIVQKEGEQSSVSSHLKKLKESWQVKDESHRQARNFIYAVWPKCNTSDKMKANMDQARKALQTCRAAGDKLSPLKLLKANIAHTAQLNKESEGLEPEKNEEDRTRFQTIADVADELKKLTEEVNAFLNESK